jgi:hypothetical protein
MTTSSPCRSGADASALAPCGRMHDWDEERLKTVEPRQINRFPQN